jgi:hypothetical protein
MHRGGRVVQAGYVGEDVESVLYKLLVACDFNVELAQRGTGEGRQLFHAGFACRGVGWAYRCSDA